MTGADEGLQESSAVIQLGYTGLPTLGYDYIGGHGHNLGLHLRIEYLVEWSNMVFVLHLKE